jgi:hypothetical protein
MPFEIRGGGVDQRRIRDNDEIIAFSPAMLTSSKPMPVDAR